MDSCSFPAIETEFDAMVAAVADAQGIDPICSTSSWIVPEAEAFSPGSTRHVRGGDNGFLAFLGHDTPSGPVLTSFDSVWGFATPLIGPDPALIVDDLAALLRPMDFHLVSVSGLDPKASLFDEIQRLGPAGYTDTADRCVADLSAGFDAWLGRRSSRFRRSLRAAVSRGETAGVTIDDVRPRTANEALAAFERILAVEAHSWKTDANSGLVDTQLGRFTRAMSERFAAASRLRVQFARLDGADIGYVIGARVGTRYRGFQHSFDQRYPDLSIGKLLQFHTIAAAVAEGIETYDMGMHMAYKASYADRIESTVTAIIPKRT